MLVKMCVFATVDSTLNYWRKMWRCSIGSVEVHRESIAFVDV